MLNDFTVTSLSPTKVMTAAIRTRVPEFTCPNQMNDLVDAFVQTFTANGERPNAQGFQKIAAIKAVREVAYIGLKDSKEIVEAIWRNYEERQAKAEPELTAYQREALAKLDTIRTNIENGYADQFVLALIRDLLSIVGLERVRTDKSANPWNFPEYDDAPF